MLAPLISNFGEVNLSELYFLSCKLELMAAPRGCKRISAALAKSRHPVNGSLVIFEPGINVLRTTSRGKSLQESRGESVLI